MDNNNVAGTTNETNNEKRMEKLRDFGKKNRTDLNNFIAFNDKVEMSSQERNFWEKRIQRTFRN